VKRVPQSRPVPTGDPRRFVQPDNIKKLLVAAASASSLGIAVMDSQTRIESVNSSLAREMRVAPNDPVGKTARELVGEVVLPMEKVHERVLSLGQPESLLIRGRVRNTPDFGYWLNYCFPIKDGSGRVQQLGLFGVNVTAEKASVEIFDALATDPKLLTAKATGLLEKFDESINHYHWSLNQTFEELASPFTELPRKLDCFRSSIIDLDNEIGAMRELVYAVHAHFSIGEC